jgi:hypothetical protein
MIGSRYALERYIWETVPSREIAKLHKLKIKVHLPIACHMIEMTMM